MNRGEFMNLVYGSASHKDVVRIGLAYDLAKKLSKGQFRREIDADGKPVRYFEHLRRVAFLLINRGVTDADVIIAALLHDSIEDTEETRLVSTIVHALFGVEVQWLVVSLTKVPKAGYYERLRASAESTQGLVLLVKAADRLDNLSTLPLDDAAFCEKQKRETRDVLLPIFVSEAKYVQQKHMACYLSLINDIKLKCG